MFEVVSKEDIVTKSPLQVDQWEEEQVYFSGDSFFNDIFLEIENAKSSIFIETYIFKEGYLTTRLFESLYAARARGIRVKLLVDGFGSWSYSFKKIKLQNKSGIQIGVYHPTPFYIASSIFEKIKKFKKMFQSWGYLNRRNHRKICIFDHKTAFVGSMNLTDDHLIRINGANAWKDAGVKVKGDEVKFLLESFNYLWKKSWTSKKNKINLFIFKNRYPKLLRLNHYLYLKIYSKKQLKKIINDTKKVLWITNAYFVPKKFLVDLLTKKAKEGVDVRVLIPANSDMPIVRLASIAFYESLISSGVRIYEYKLGMLHAKTILTDRMGLIGSSNMNHRSILHDLEADVCINKKENLEEMYQQFVSDIASAEEIKAKNKHSMLTVMLARFVLFIRYWL